MHNPIPSSQRFSKRVGSLNVSHADALAAFRDVLPHAEALNVVSLSGGYSSANFSVMCDDARFVVRFMSGDIGAARRELAVMQLAENAGIRVPKIIGTTEFPTHRMAAVLEFIDGQPLTEVLVSNSDDVKLILHRVGSTLAKIHRVSFAQAGFLSEHGDVVDELRNFCESMRAYILQTLSGLAGTRLESDLQHELRDVLAHKWDSVASTYGGPVLVHCDFNPKNILIMDAATPVVLDWEFAMSGHHLMDVGNFLRFEEDYTKSGIDAFKMGYFEGGGRLTADDETAACLLDLTSMCGFLDRDEDLPNTFRTAVEIIRRILNRSA